VTHAAREIDEDDGLCFGCVGGFFGDAGSEAEVVTKRKPKTGYDADLKEIPAVYPSVPRTT
jgi:hypothetical protein